VSKVPADEGHDLEDEPLQQEIVLLGELMAAAAGATQHLQDQQIDELLDEVAGDAPSDKPDKTVGGPA
jgi:hypothetical protein